MSDVVIKNCNIYQDDRFIPSKSVILSKGVIAGIHDADFKVSDEILTIDGTNKYLIPGLINLHVHVNRRNVSRTNGTFRSGAPAIENSSDGRRMLFALNNAWYELLQGITTMRDLCSVGRTATQLRDAIREGLVNGPRLITCGLGIAATGGHETHRYQGAVEVDGCDEVMKAVRNEIKLGADFIKIMSSGGIGGMPEHEHPDWAELSIAEIEAGVFAAHTHKKDVTVHAMGIEPVMAALKGGVDGIEHGTVLTKEALDIMKTRKIWYVPTASGITAVAEKEKAKGNEELANEINRIVVLPQRESIRNAHEYGILIGAGSDTLGSVLNELLIFEECGFSKAESLDTATVNAAKILHMDDKIGHIREGYIADLVLLDDNPLEDLRNISNVSQVFKDGISVTRTWLMNLK